VHPWSGLVVLPLFALANSGIRITADGITEALASPVAIGIFLALALGKPLGIFAASALTVRLGAARLPAGSSLSQIAGIGILAGIGFTVSIFIAELAFVHEAAADVAKLGIFAASTVAAIAGWFVLRWTSSRRST
jgi:Na+/H+ antiporter NhaA